MENKKNSESPVNFTKAMRIIVAKKKKKRRGFQEELGKNKRIYVQKLQAIVCRETNET